MKHDSIERKFIDSVEVIGHWEIESEEGFVPITHIHKTVEYVVYEVTLANGLSLQCADTHILMNSAGEEVFAYESLGESIKTALGDSIVVSVESLGRSEHMYDATVDSDAHTYYTNDILSHNTQTNAALVLHYLLFEELKTVAILANKASMAREILNRIKQMYSALPLWMQQGVTTWNKGSIELGNGCTAIAAATSSSAIRGFSISWCVGGDTKVTICDEEDRIFHQTIAHFKKNKNIKMSEIKHYFVYKTTNTVNNKEYIGVHSTYDMNDGYLGSGKILKRAIEKYGPESFCREILFQCDSFQEALRIERTLVNEEYIKLDCTYNVCLGGAGGGLPGKLNPFYGKTHPPNIRELIRRKLKECTADRSKLKFVHCESGAEILGRKGLDSFFNTRVTRGILGKLFYDGIIDCDDEIIKIKYLMRYDKIRKNKERLAAATRARFSGVPLSEENKEKISIGIKKWIEENKEEHYAKMLKINKNSDKIEKTRKFHLGRTRSDETKKRISESLLNHVPGNKGKFCIFNIHSAETKFVNEEEFQKYDCNYWKRGNPKTKTSIPFKWYNKDGKIKRFYDNDNVPVDWTLGRK